MIAALPNAYQQDDKRISGTAPTAHARQPGDVPAIKADTTRTSERR